MFPAKISPNQGRNFAENCGVLSCHHHYPDVNEAGTRLLQFPVDIDDSQIRG